MPVVALRPIQARLVIEPGRESLLMMKVVVAQGESIALAGGGMLEALGGTLRIRERGGDKPRDEGGPAGTLAYVEASGEGEKAEPAHFQVSISMSAAKFDALLKVAIAGQLPTRFYVQAGEARPGREPEGFGHTVRGGERIRAWDIENHRTVPIANFSAILPIAVGAGAGPRALPALPAADRMPAESRVAGSDQVAELADQFAVFQGETKNALTAVVSVVAVIGVLLLLINLVLIIR